MVTPRYLVFLFVFVGDTDVLALFSFKLYFPCSFPNLKAIEIALEGFFLSFCFDDSVHRWDL